MKTIAPLINPDATVNTKAEFIAAIRAVAHPTYEEARKNPVTIQYKTTQMTFSEGIHTKRAEDIALRLRRDPDFKGMK